VILEHSGIPMTTEDLLTKLSANTDLTLLVKRVSAQKIPWVVVSSAATADWQRRDPAAWTHVSEWVATRGVALVRI